MKKILLFLPLVAVLFTSCKKDEGCSLSEESLVGTYKIGTIKYKASASSPEVDGKSLLLEDCELDDTQTFKADKTYIYADAGTACEENGTDAGTWSLTGNTITVDGEAQAVASFDCGSFSITETDVLDEGDRITVTFVKQ